MPGLVVGVLHEGDVTTAADGVAKLGRPDPVAPSTAVRIASVTKPIVATLTLTLVQDGLLDLDAPPPGTRTDATVRQLLSHQGGIAAEWPERLDPNDDSDEALLRVAAERPTPLPVAAGELFSYCNVGYWLVGAAIAQVLETTFEHAMQARVLGPLGLSSTGFEPPPGAACGHEQVEPFADEHEPFSGSYPRARRPSGGLWSTVDDLLRFAEHQLGGPGPLTPASIHEMQRGQVRTGSYEYGLGWFVSSRNGVRHVEHAGSAAGFQSLLLLVPEKRVAFSALSNSSRGAAAIRDVREELGLGPEPRPDVAVTPADLEALAGRYAGKGLEARIVPEDGRLRVQLSEFDLFTGETTTYPSVLAGPVAAREFEIMEREWRGERFDFPRDGFVRFGMLAQRVE